MRSYLKLFLVAIAFFTTSCLTELKEISVNGIENFKVTKLSKNGIEGEVYVSIKNPNNIGFKIFRSKADIYYGGTYLGKAKLSKKVKVSANSNATYTFKLKGDLKDVGFGDLAGLFAGQKKQMEIKGHIKAGKWFYKKRFPIDEKQKLKGLDYKGGIPGF